MKRILVAGMFAAALAAAAEPLRIIVTGQSYLRDDPRRVAPRSFPQMVPCLAGADVVFTNVEGAVWGPGAGASTRPKKLFHPMNTAVLDEMKAEGFNTLATASNHAWDYDTGGIVSTLRAVEERGFLHAGTGRNLGEAAAPAFRTTPHGTVALVAMASGRIAPGAAATADRPGVDSLEVDAAAQRVNPTDAARILASIRTAAARADCVIVYDHNHYWAKDLHDTPAWIRDWARACIDAGGKIFVEHGETVLHGIQLYHGGIIFYGLGNFTFETRGQEVPGFFDGLVATCTLTRGRLDAVRLVPLRLEDWNDPTDTAVRRQGYPFVAHGKQAQETLERIGKLSAEYGTRIDGAAVVIGRR